MTSATQAWCGISGGCGAASKIDNQTPDAATAIDGGSIVILLK